ncbi:MAG TPA: heme-binding protein [Vicinamibacterales bacterium]|nr:heme-binding protein [Vicinamibacterales bacterium]
MPNRSLVALSFLCISVLTASAAHAQTLLSEKKDLTGFAARKMIEACMAEAARDRYPIALAVVDSAGYLLSYQSTDGATGNTGVTAQLKAKTAAKFRRPTGELYERVNRQINRAPEWMGYFPIPGGFPIVVQGEVVGAIGAGAAGLSGGKDEDCAQNAIKSVFGDGKTLPASAQPLLATRKVITTAAARALVDACVTYAGQKKYTALGIAVVDPDGTLVSFQGTEGATATALETAELKATTAAHWRRPTIELWERVNKQVNRAPEWMGDFAQPGGFPIFLNNEMVGAIGAGGGVGNQDDECAQAAIKAVFPNASTTRSP